jgi:hypothetical protein
MSRTAELLYNKTKDGETQIDPSVFLPLKLAPSPMETGPASPQGTSSEFSFLSNLAESFIPTAKLVSATRTEQLLQKLAAPPKSVPLYELGHVVQMWEGSVTQVGEESFVARLLDKSREMKIDTEEAEIPLSEVDKGDRVLVKEGAIFYLTIKRRIVSGSGRQETSSNIVFRRMPKWHRSTLDAAKAEAKQLAAFFET